jgi:hypothetical protein
MVYQDPQENPSQPPPPPPPDECVLSIICHDMMHSSLTQVAIGVLPPSSLRLSSTNTSVRRIHFVQHICPRRLYLEPRVSFLGTMCMVKSSDCRLPLIGSHQPGTPIGRNISAETSYRVKRSMPWDSPPPSKIQIHRPSAPKNLRSSEGETPSVRSGLKSGSNKYVADGLSLLLSNSGQKLTLSGLLPTEGDPIQRDQPPVILAISSLVREPCLRFVPLNPR